MTRSWHDFEVIFPIKHRSRWQSMKEDWLRKYSDVWYCFWKEIENYQPPSDKGRIVLFIGIRNNNE